MDVLLRCVNSSFFLSHSLRRDVEAFLVMKGGEDPPKTLRFVGDGLRYLNPDERSTASLVRNALLRKVGDEEVGSSPGIFISRMDLEDVLEKLAEVSEIIYLKEDGEDVRDVTFDGDLTFVLGDDRDLDEDEEAILKKYSARSVRLGPLSYHSDHCITIVHNELDRRQ